MDRIEIRPTRSRAILGWLAAASWLAFLVLILVAGWSGFDLASRMLVAFVLAVSAGFTLLMATGWSTLAIRADAREVRFGKRVIQREDIATIDLEPPGDTPLRFWLGVATMAVTQDQTRMVCFRAADGRALLRVGNVYGRDRLRQLADYLNVPLRGA